MEFAEAVRLAYNQASDMGPFVDEGVPDELQRQAQCELEALDLICECFTRGRLSD